MGGSERLPTGELLGQLSGHQDLIWEVEYSPDGNQLVTIGGDGKVLMWEMEFDSLIEQGCTWVKSYLQSHPTVEKDIRAFCSENT